MTIQNKTMLITTQIVLEITLKTCMRIWKNILAMLLGEFTFYHFSRQQVIADLHQWTMMKWIQRLVIGRMLSV